jgi:hypothetical protein
LYLNESNNKGDKMKGKKLFRNMIEAAIISPIFGIILSGFYLLYHANWDYIRIPDYIKEKVAKADPFSPERSFTYHKDEMFVYWVKKSIDILPITITISLVVIFILKTLKDIKNNKKLAKWI